MAITVQTWVAVDKRVIQIEYYNLLFNNLIPMRNEV